MFDSVRPHRRQPTRLCCPWDSPGKNTGVGCHFLFQCMKVKSESEVAQSCPTFSDPMDCSPPGSSIHGICQARVGCKTFLDKQGLKIFTPTCMLSQDAYRRICFTQRRSFVKERKLKEISPKYSLEGLTLKLKLQYSGHLT